MIAIGMSSSIVRKGLFGFHRDLLRHQIPCQHRRHVFVAVHDRRHEQIQYFAADGDAHFPGQVRLRPTAVSVDARGSCAATSEHLFYRWEDARRRRWIARRSGYR